MSKDLFFEEQSRAIEEAVSEIKNGDSDGLEAYAVLNQIEKMAKEKREEIRPFVIEEAYNHLEGNLKEFTIKGIKFEVRKGATRYSFKNIKKWVEKNKELKEVEDQSKTAYLARQKGVVSATEDGEDIEYPDITYSKDSLVVKSFR